MVLCTAGVQGDHNLELFRSIGPIESLLGSMLLAGYSVSTTRYYWVWRPMVLGYLASSYSLPVVVFASTGKEGLGTR